MAGDKLESVSIKKGEPAPFDGQCMTAELAIKLVIKADQCDIRIALETKRLQDLRDNDKELFNEKRAIDNERADGQIEFLKKRLDDATAWYTHPAFVIPVTVAAVIGIMLGARHLIVETQP